LTGARRKLSDFPSGRYRDELREERERVRERNSRGELEIPLFPLLSPHLFRSFSFPSYLLRMQLLGTQQRSSTAGLKFFSSFFFPFFLPPPVCRSAGPLWTPKSPREWTVEEWMTGGRERIAAETPFLSPFFFFSTHSCADSRAIPTLGECSQDYGDQQNSKNRDWKPAPSFLSPPLPSIPNTGPMRRAGVYIEGRQVLVPLLLFLFPAPSGFSRVRAEGGPNGPKYRSSFLPPFPPLPPQQRARHLSLMISCSYVARVGQT